MGVAGSDLRAAAAGQPPPIGVRFRDDLLELPWKCERPGILRFEAGLVLDGPLRRLASLSGAIDRGIARRLRRLRGGRGYVRLGYALFRDYVRERLSLSARTAQEMVRLGEGLERLPLLDEALAGGRLTWTKALEVTRVAGRQDEAAWVERAQRLTVRELKSRVRSALEARAKGGSPTFAVGDNLPAGSPTSAGGDNPPAGSPTFAGDGEDDGNSPVRAGTSAGYAPAGETRAGTASGRIGNFEQPDRSGDFVEPDARRTGRMPNAVATGDPLPERLPFGMPNGASESNGPHCPSGCYRIEEHDGRDPTVRLSVSANLGSARLWEAALDLCDLVAGADLAPAEAPEYLLADFLSGRTSPGDGAVDAGREGTPLCRRGTGRGNGSSPSRPLAGDVAPELGPASILEPLAEDLRRELERIRELVDGPVPADPFELDWTMRQLLGLKRGLDLDLARLLRNFQSLGLARWLGYGGFAEYVEDRLSISARRAGRLVGLDRRLTSLSEVSWAVRAGWIGTEAAWQLSRVTVGERRQREWVRHARRCTVLRLKEEADWVLRRARLSGRPWERGAPPPPGRLRTVLEELTAELDDLTAQPGRPVAESVGLNAESVGLTSESAGTIAESPGLTTAPTELIARAAALDAVPTRLTAESASCAQSLGLTAQSAGAMLRGDLLGAVTPTFAGPGCEGNPIKFRASHAPMFAGPQDESDTDAPAEPGSARAVAALPRDVGAEHDEDAVDPARLRGLLERISRKSADGPSIDITFRLRRSAIGLWNAARRSLAADTGDRFVRDRDVLRRVALDFLCTWLPLWLHEVRRGDPVAVRERFRCGIPGCTVRGGSAHHVRFRSRGGTDEPSNLLFTCYTHHIEGVHRGRVRVRGRAPNRLVVELGIRPDGTALETFVDGERPLPEKTPSEGREGGGENKVN